MTNIALAVHGGAGTILRSKMSPELEGEYRGALGSALQSGWSILNDGGTSLDAVETAVAVLEDFPLFNAGRGSVFTHDGKQEMDAAILDGHNLRAGAVAFVKNIKNPIKLARLVMGNTEHILLAGDGANEFAEQQGVRLEPDEYFFTEQRWLELQEAIADDRIQLDHFTAETPRRREISEQGRLATGSRCSKPIGTVGAVACDKNGFLAAATSTGGMTNKKFGRVGDTAIIGAGTYADDICAVSCTGHGEYFMLGVTAFDVAARMKYKNLSLQDAAQETINHLTKIGGEGGMIAVDSNGNLTMPFNSEGMYRGEILASGKMTIKIYQ